MSGSETESQRAQEFKISLEGAELPAEVIDRIHKALHRAVLQELADVDLGPRQGVRSIELDRSSARGPGGKTDGIDVRTRPE